MSLDDLRCKHPNLSVRELVALHEQLARATPPTEAAMLERGNSFANQAVWTLDLQLRRLGTAEPEDEDFIFRAWADLEFFILTLWHLRTAARLALRVPAAQAQIDSAIAAFDVALPYLKRMRDVIEHKDDYSVDAGRAKPQISRRQLQVGQLERSKDLPLAGSGSESQGRPTCGSGTVFGKFIAA